MLPTKIKLNNTYMYSLFHLNLFKSLKAGSKEFGLCREKKAKDN